MLNNLSSNEKKPNTTTKKFQKLSEKVSSIVGSPYWFAFSLLLILIWLPTGFIFGWGEIWHLLINTTTTILTFLMMSLLHASQSKWERKMERLQSKEGSEIKVIKEHTEKIVKQEKINKENTNKESVSSLR